MVVRKTVDKELHTEKYIIGYIDLLGSTEKIRNDNDDKWLNVVNKLYNEAWYCAGVLNEISTSGKPDIKIFSDNILIAEKIPKNANARDIMERVLRVLIFLANIQAHALIDYQWMARGSIILGDLYVSDPEVDREMSFIWGKGLIHAYGLEDTVAVYPRILIDNSLSDFKNGGNIRVKDGIDSLRFAFTDSDGLSYLNYLELYIVETLSNYDDNQVLSRVSDILSEMSAKHKNSDSIMRKIEWTKHYLDLVIADKEYLDNTEGDRMYLNQKRFKERDL